MYWDNCEMILHMAVAAGTSLALPRHAEQLVGLAYLCAGSGVLSGASGAPEPLAEKSAVLYPAWQKQALSVCEDTALLLCAFRCQRPEELLSRWAAEHGPVCDCRELPDAQRLLPQLDALSPRLGQSPGVQPASLLLDVLLGRAQAEDREIPAYLQAVRALIDARYGEDLTLDVLAAHVGRSKFHLSRAFRSYYQMTPSAYLTSVRLSQAARLLADTGLPVREIGQRVGIGNSTYFTSLFKQRYGSSPREYRLRSQRR